MAFKELTITHDEVLDMLPTILLLVFLAQAYAQDACKQPLQAADLKDLLTKRVNEVMIQQLIVTCGLTMNVDAAVEKQLTTMGASAALLDAVRSHATSASRSELELRTELEYWSSIKEATDPIVFEDYLKRYPKGRFVVIAQAKLRSLALPTPTLPTPKGETPALPTRTTSLPGLPKPTAPPTRSWHLRHNHNQPAAFGFGGTKHCIGTITVTAQGIAFRPDTPDGHTIDVLGTDINRVIATAFPNNFGVSINYSIDFYDLKHKIEGDELFDAIGEVMRYHGKFDGEATTPNVFHFHNLIRFCRGRLTITPDAIHFVADDQIHNLSYRKGEQPVRLRPATDFWAIEILDKGGKKQADFMINTWEGNIPLRNIWGKPNRKDKKNWEYWE